MHNDNAVLFRLAIVFAFFLMLSISIIVASRYQSRKHLSSLASNVTPQYQQMLSVVAARHQEPRRFPIRNERQEEHYLKASLAAMHTAFFHDNG